MSDRFRVDLTVDGTEHVATIVGDESLLVVLRDHLGLVAVKDGCSEGVCGSCTVWLDDEVVCSCILPAFQADGASIRTAGSDHQHLRVVQDALAACDGVQCGFCTPGVAVAAADLIERIAGPNEADLAEALHGNLCRCTGYVKILDAVRAAMEPVDD